MIKCSIGVCVYNEEKNIVNLINSLLAQQLKNVSITEIIVVSSGSFDKTVDLIKFFAKRNKKIKLIIQKKREGKASAVNLFISKAKNEVLVLVGGDLALGKDTIEKLVKEFKNPEIGMTGCHPISVSESKNDLVHFSGKLLWELHHRISLIKPKMGEVIAFRKVFKRIPVFSSVDEANIEPLIRGQAYTIKYVSGAKIYNKIPSTLKDFISQRRRIYNGHLAVKSEQSYEVATMDLALIIKVYLSLLKENLSLKFILMSLGTVCLEAYCRFLGWLDYKMGKRHTIWTIAETTKKLS